MKRGTLMLAALTLLLAGFGRANGGNILVNGDFESEPSFGNGVENGYSESAVTGNQIPGWTIAPNTAVTIHSNPGLYPTISGNYSINMDGEGYNGSTVYPSPGQGNNGILYQDFSSTSGTSYNLQFDWESWQDNAPSTQLQVSVTDTTTNAVLFNGLYSYNGFDVVTHESTTFTGSGDTLRLQIQETPKSGFNDNQFVVDNFSVTANPAATPEPASLTLLGLGACGLAGYGWRKRRETCMVR